MCALDSKALVTPGHFSNMLQDCPWTNSFSLGVIPPWRAGSGHSWTPSRGKEEETWGLAVQES